MICERCDGTGTFTVRAIRGKSGFTLYPALGWPSRPCPECQGSGIVSCCDTAGASEVLSPSDIRLIWPESRIHDCDEAAVITGASVNIDLPTQYLKPEDYWADADRIVGDDPCADGSIDDAARKSITEAVKAWKRGLDPDVAKVERNDA